jgi:uncharacterized protein
MLILKELAESVRLLVEAGADINAICSDQQTALMCASKSGCCSKVMQVFLQNGADVLLRTLDGLTALHFTAAVGRTDRCELLLASAGSTAGSLVRIQDVNGCPALLQAVSSGSIDTVELLLHYGADRTIVNNLNRTPLMVACAFDHVEMAAYLIREGADVNAVDSGGVSALMLAAERNCTALARLLLDNGAAINGQLSTGTAALTKATFAGHINMMKLLVQRGFSVTTLDSKGRTLLMVATIGRHKPAVEWLIQQGAAVNAVAANSDAALILANTSSCDNAAIVDLLLANGADVHMCSTYGMTALHVAALNGNLQCAKALITAGADVNHTNLRGFSALHTAVKAKHAAVVQLLLEHGATAVMNNTVRMQCSGGARCCSSNATALMLCTTVDTVKALLAAGANVHVTTSSGDTCLHIAAKHNYTAPMLCLLIKAGADLHAVNSAGKTAAQIAQDRGHTLIEQLLNRAAQQGHTRLQ